MRVFFALFIANIAATGLRLAIDKICPGFLTDPSLMHSLDPLGNILFILITALVVGHMKSVRLMTVQTAIGVLAFFLAIIAVSLAGIMLFAGLGVGLDLLALIGTIGYYPAGADVPIEHGLQLWIASSLLPIGIGLVLGALLLHLKGTRKSSDSNSPSAR